jgi:hypothetical protein
VQGPDKSLKVYTSEIRKRHVENTSHLRVDKTKSRQSRREIDGESNDGESEDSECPKKVKAQHEPIIGTVPKKLKND